MYGIAEQTECLRKKYSSKKHNKAWRSGKALAFGLRSKGHRQRYQSDQGSYLGGGWRFGE